VALALLLALWRRTRRARLVLLAVAGLAVAGAGAPPSGANVVAFDGLEPLLGHADGVVQGRVLSVEPYWSEADGHVHSTVRVEVTQWLRGDGPAILELDRPSGTLPEIATLVPGDPRFVAGQELVLVLGTRVDGRPGLVGMSEGWIEIAAPDGVPVARRHPAGPGTEALPGGTEVYPLRPLLTYLSSP